MFTLTKSTKVFAALVISIFSGTLLSAQINFNNPGLNGASAAGAAPPQWVVCSSTPDIQPGQWCVELPAFEGATYAGFSDDEFIGQRLNCSLVKGKNYSMSLYLAYNPDYARTQALGLCPDAGIRGNAGNFQLWAGKVQCSKQELLYESGTLSAAHENNWIQHVIKFKPKDTYDFILLCAKPDDGSTNVLVDAISQTIVQEPDSFSVDNSNLLCFGDQSATATVYPPNATGSNYTYSWNTNPVQTTQTATGLGVGVYTCTITDNNGPCTASFDVSVTVTGPAKLEVNTICTDVSLPGIANGTSTATILGGTPPYNIVWSTGDVGLLALTNLDAGTYTVTVTDKNGCKATSSCAIVNPFCNLSLDDTEVENLKCFGVNDGSIEVDVSTSNPPISYSWNTTPVKTTKKIEDLGPGVYTVTITDDAGCTLSESFVLDAPSPLQLSLSGDSASCYDGLDASALAQASGGVSPYSFSWPGSSSANYQGPAGEIICTLTDDNGCSIRDTIFLGQPEEFDHVVSLTNSSCPEVFDATISNTVSGGTAPYTYGLDLSNMQSNSLLSQVAPGVQWVFIRDSKGCVDSLEVEVLSDTVEIVVPADTSICQGQSITLSALGMEQIFWDNNLSNNTVISPNNSKDYIAYGSNASGCAAQDTFTVEVIPYYDPSIIPAGPFCKGSPDFQFAAADTGGLWSGANVTAQGLFSPSTLSDGTYWIYYEFPGACGDKDSIEVLVNSSFDASINPVDTLCHGEASFKLTSATNGGFWYGPGMLGNNSDSLSPNFSTVLAGPGTHRVFHLIPGECGDTAFTDIVVLAPDTGKINNPGPLCSDAPTFQVSASPANGTWSGSGISATGDFNPSALNPDTSYMVYYTPQGFCVLQDSSNLRVLPPLQVSPDTFLLSCFGDNNGQLNAIVSGGLEPYSYQWSPNGVNTPNISGLSAGSYSLSVTDAANCQGSAVSEVMEPNPLIFRSSTVVIDDSCAAACKGAIRVFAGGGVKPYQYRISGRPWQNDSVFSNLCAANYLVEVRDANACLISENHNINEPAPIQIQDSIVTDFCLQGVGEIVIKSISGGTTPYQFSWSNGSSTQNQTGLVAGDYSLVISDAKFCTQSFSFTVPNYGGPQLTPGSTPAVCQGQANGKAFVSASGGTPGYSFSWNTGASGDTLFNVGAGTYQVTVTDASGCNALTDVQVTEPSAVVLENIADTLLCDGQQFTYTPNIQEGNGGPYSLELNGNALSNNQLTISQSGGYALQAFDVRGCPSNFSNFQVAYRDPISLDFQADSICPGASINLQLNPSGGLNNYVFNWAHGATGNPVQFQARSQGQADTAVVTISDGCSNPLQVEIPIPFFDNATPQITVTPQTGCVPLTSNFEVEDLGFQSVEWRMGDGRVISNQIQFDYVYTQAGDYTPKLRVISAEGCFNELQAPAITAYPLPTGSITQFPSVITEANNEARFAIAGNYVAGAEWTLSRLGDTLLQSNAYPLSYTFSSDTGSFDLHAIMVSPFGCEAPVRRTVLVRKELRLFIPNAFSPNGDGSNDVFGIEATGLELNGFSISIHNRWGEQVFSSKDPQFGWDGIYLGEEAQPGTYAWALKYLDALGNPKTLMGTVTLIR